MVQENGWENFDMIVNFIYYYLCLKNDTLLVEDQSILDLE